MLHGGGDVLGEVAVVSEEVGGAGGEGGIEFGAHVVDIAGNGELDVVLLPVEGGMDIHIPLLMQKAVGGLYAVLCYHIM